VSFLLLQLSGHQYGHSDTSLHTDFSGGRKERAEQTGMNLGATHSSGEEGSLGRVWPAAQSAVSLGGTLVLTPLAVAEVGSQ
jgi:hypothetical protein